MKATHIALALEAAIAARKPAIIFGPPGVGKSDLVRQVALSLGYELQDLRTTLLDAVDLRGVPSVVRNGSGPGRTVWNPPIFFPENGRWIIFLDELPNAPQMVQSALLQLVLDRQLGEYRLPDDCVVIAAGNRVQDRAGAGRLISPLSDRFIQLEFEVDLDDWVTWAISNRLREEIIYFLRFRPELLSVFDPAQPVSPSPRSWETVSRMLPHLKPEVEFDVLAGIVGEGAASECVGFMRVYRDIPDPDAVLLDPAHAPVPDVEKNPATLYALCGALARRASSHTAERIITYANRLPDEFNVLLITDAARTDREGMIGLAFAQWAADHRDVLS